MKHRIFKIPTISFLASTFAFFMAVFLFGQTYPTSCMSSYDYVALGDSYCAGQTPYDVTEGYSYSDMIDDKLESAGILGSYHKKGVSGYTTTDLKGQLPSIKGILYQAEIVTIDIGINDILQMPEVQKYLSNPTAKNFDTAQAAATRKIPKVASNIKELINEIKDANPYSDPQIYIMGYFNALPDLPEFLPVIESLNVAINEAATEIGITYIDTMAAIDEHLKEYFPGDIHPTVEGYKAIAEEFWEAINEDFLTNPSVYKLPYDINGHWAENNIKKYIEAGIITGFYDGSFKPDHAITRAEFVTIINKYFNLTATTDIDFIDVPNNAWYRTEIEKAVKAGYISGNNYNCFKANEYVTRQEAAVIIARKMDFKILKEDHEVAPFRDGKDIPPWSLESVNAMVRNGIMRGYPDNSFGYQGNLTRAEVLSLLDNITVYINNHAPNV